MAQFWTDSSLLLALQADLTTPSTLAANEFVALLCDTPKLSFNTEVTELELTTGQVGAAPEKIVGRRSGSITFAVPMQAFKTGYDPTAENPGGAPVGGVDVIPPWLALVANALGCNVGSLAGATLSDKNTNFWKGTHLSNTGYGAAKVTAAGTDSTHLEVDAGEQANHKGGQLVAAATGVAAAPFLGFVKSLAGQVFTVFEAARAPTGNYDDNAANVYGTATAWQSDNQPKLLTAYWTGPNTKACYVLSGLVCESFKITLDAGQVPTVEFTYRFYDYYLDKTKGGLVVPDSYNRTPQLVGAKSGQLMLDTAVKCGLEGVSLEWKATIRESKCHYAEQGISSVAIVKPKIIMGFSVPHDADNDLAYDAAGSPGNVGSHQWQASLELGTTHSVSLYVGPAAGKCFALMLPAAKVSAVPAIGDRDGAQAYTIQVEAGTYSGDSACNGETSFNSPLNSIVRVALA